MKKVLFMLTSMNIGGVEKSLLSLLSCIPKDKYEITLLLLDKSGGFLDYVPNHINIEECNWFKDVKPIIMNSPYEIIKTYKNKKQYGKIFKFIYCYLIDKYFDNRFLYYKFAMRDVPINDKEYDLAISYQGPTDIIDYYIGNKIKAKKKISWLHFDVSKHSFNKKLYEKLYEAYDKVFVVSKEGRKKLIEAIPQIESKTDVFMNIVSKDLIEDMSNEDVEFDNDFNGTKIVTVGRLSKEKGQDLAIESLRMLKEEGYNVRWYCIGDGNNRKDYEDLIKKYNLEDDFILLGAKTNPYPYIKEADIYVQTSRHEGYCLTLSEAKCLNKPIVTTNFIGAYEQIEDNYNGLITNCNVNEIYEAIKSLIKDKEKRNSLTNNLINGNLDTTEEINKLFNYIG